MLAIPTEHSGAIGLGLGLDRQTDRRTDGRMDRFLSRNSDRRNRLMTRNRGVHDTCESAAMMQS